MKSEKMLHEALTSMHAADDLEERVLAEANGHAPKRCKSHPRTLVSVIIFGIAIALVGGATVAVASSDIVVRIWESFGSTQHTEWGLPGSDFHGTMEYEHVDPAKLSEELGIGFDKVGYQVKGFGYTLDIQSMATDINGNGVVKMVLSNPDGIEYFSQYGVPGELALNGEDDADGLGAISMELPNAADGNRVDFADTRIMFDRERSTDTQMYLTMYFCAWGNIDSLRSGVAWRLGGSTGEKDYTSDTFVPSQVVDGREYTSGSVKAYVTPFSIKVADGGKTDSEILPRYVSFVMADGTELVVHNDDPFVANHLVNALGGRNEAHMVLGTQVNVDEVAEVHVTLSRETSDGELVDQDFVLKP